MNNNEYMAEIDLLDLLGRIISKWRPILLSLLIGLIVGGVAATVMGVLQKNDDDLESKQKYYRNSVKQAVDKLLENEKGEELKEIADNYFAKYTYLQNINEMQEEYIDNSIYMSLDATAVSTGRLVFAIDNHYVNEYPVINGYNNIDDVIAVYKNVLTSNEVCSEIAEIIGVDTEPKYIKELIGVSAPSTGTLSVFVQTSDEETTEKICEYYVAKMKSLTKELRDDFGKLDYSLQTKSVITEANQNVLKTQNAQHEILIENNDSMQKILKAMSGAQLEYFEALQKQYSLEKRDSVEQLSLMSYISKRLIVIVAFVFAMFSVCWYGCKYVFDGTVKTGDELAQLSRMPVLGTVLLPGASGKKRKVVFDKWAAALTDKKVIAADSETVSSAITEFAKKEEYKSVTIISSGVAHQDTVEAVKNYLEKEVSDVKLCAGDDLGAADIKAIAASDGIVLIAEIGKAKIRKLQHVMQICSLYSANLIGAVAIQEKIGD